MLRSLSLLVILSLSSVSLKGNAREDAVAEFAEYLQETQKNLSYIERREYDRLRQLTVIYRKNSNVRELYKAHEKLLAFNPGSVQAWRYAAWSVGYLYSGQEIEISDEEDYLSAKLGIQMLLNGISEHPESAFLHDELGWYLGFRLDRMYGNGSLRTLFQKDKKLHQSLSKQVDL